MTSVFNFCSDLQPLSALDIMHLMIEELFEIIPSHPLYQDRNQYVRQVKILIKVNLRPHLSSGSSTPRQIPRDNLLSSLHNSINDLSYSVEPQQRGSIEKYREIKDKV